MLPAKVEVTPAVPKVTAPAGAIDTVPVPVGDNVTVLSDPVKLKLPDRVVLPVTPSVSDAVKALATVTPAAATVKRVAPSAATVIDPVPASVTVTLELPCVIEFCDRPAKPSSTYFLLATSPSAVGAAVDNPVILFVEASITISPTDIPLLTLKFLVVMVPYLPHDCYYFTIERSIASVFTQYW